MKWITREKVKVDRVACPWLIKKFVDPQAEFIFTPANKVLDEAGRLGAIPYDVTNVELGHHGEDVSFNSILKKYNLDDPALQLLGEIVRAADTDTLDRSAQAAGLLAISLGLGVNIGDDQELLKTALPIYDALYTWCRSLDGERHGWHPQTILKDMGL